MLKCWKDCCRIIGFHLNGHTLFAQSQNLEQLDAQSVSEKVFKYNTVLSFFLLVVTYKYSQLLLLLEQNSQLFSFVF